MSAPPIPHASAALFNDPSGRAATEWYNYWRKLADELRNISTNRYVLTPEDFGADGVTAARTDAALRAMAAKTDELGGDGITWLFKPGRTYKVFDLDGLTLGAQNFLLRVGPTRGLRIIAAQSSFECDTDWVVDAPSTFAYFMHFTDALGLDIDGINFANTVPLVTDVNSTGVILATFGDTCRGVRVGPIYQLGGRDCVAIDRSSGFIADVGTLSERGRGSGFVFDLIDTEDVYYPLETAMNGDFIKANIKAKNAARPYFLTSSSYHAVSVDIFETRTIAQAIDLTCKCEPDGENKLTNIDVTVGGTMVGSCVAMGFQQSEATAAAGKIHNIAVRYRVQSGSGAGGNMLLIFKQAFGGAFDSTARGHSIRNVTFSGTLDLATGIVIGDLFTDGDWTGEEITDVQFRDFVVKQAGTPGVLSVDGRAITSMFIENARAAANTLTLTNMAKGTMQVGRGVSFANFKSEGVSGGVEYERFGSRIRQWGKKTCANGNANTDVTLPAALRSGEPDHVLISNRTTGNFDTAATLTSVTNLRINRASTAGDHDIDWQVTGYAAANGSPV